MELITFSDVCLSYGGSFLLGHVNLQVEPGERVCPVGRNGEGKTSLLRLVNSELTPDAGKISFQKGISIAGLTQEVPRDMEGSVFDVVAGGLKEQGKLDSEYHQVSRLLAKLFAIPSNVLVLDEPTNDLDTETLELLEELLLEYKGAIILVSHDRAFLNNAVTSTLVFEGNNGRVEEYVGGYDDWVQQKAPEIIEKPKPSVKQKNKRKRAIRPKKLTFKEQYELEALPEQIETLEAEQEALFTTMSDPEFYKQEGERVSETVSKMEELKRELEKAYERRGILDTLGEG